MDNEHLYDAPPPDYNSIDEFATSNKSVSITQLCPTDNLLDDPPPSTRWFVHSRTDPPTWKLLSGVLMSNASTQINPDPCHKRRYRILYPPNYEDVYLHKTPWTKHADALPPFHIELYGRDRYEAEPIVILGPPTVSNSSFPDDIVVQAKAIAASSLPRVITTMKHEATRTARFVKFVESEYWSWDWKCKTAAATNDMRTLISQAKQDCGKSAMLMKKTEDFLKYLGREEESTDTKAVLAMRKRVEEAKRKLKRLRL
jgi:hypothetical protein